MNKKDAKKQFDDMTEQLGIEHTFPFDIAWSFAKYVEIKGSLEKPVSFMPAEYTKEEFRVGIKDVENKMLESERSLKGKELEHFNPLKHSFAKGVYNKQFKPHIMVLQRLVLKELYMLIQIVSLLLFMQQMKQM